MTLAPEKAFLTVSTPEGLSDADQQIFQRIHDEVESLVTEAREKHEQASARVARLNLAHAAINKRGLELFKQIAEAKAALENGLIEQYTGDAGPADVAALFTAHLVANGERAALMAALVKLVQDMIPLADIGQARAEAALYQARSDEFQRIGRARLEHTAALLREACEFEGGGLTIDKRSTLSGYILAYAENLASRANELLATANKAEDAHQRAFGPPVV
jgi:hypothetical protein